MNRSLSPRDLSELRAFLHEACGIVIGDGKEYRIEGRLGPLLESEGIPDYAELAWRAREDPSGRLSRLVVEALVTGETSFFRDGWPFRLLVQLLVPDALLAQRTFSPSVRPGLDVWCAGCSTGQEVYSIAICLHELLGDLSRYRIRVLGTDISEPALAIASRGLYPRHEIARGLSPERVDRYFTAEGDGWRIADRVRAIAHFRAVNLAEPLPETGRFDIVFCRNVAIYFSQSVRERLFARIAERTRPGGALVIGATEQLPASAAGWVREQYQETVFHRKAG